MEVVRKLGVYVLGGSSNRMSGENGFVELEASALIESLGSEYVTEVSVGTSCGKVDSSVEISVGNEDIKLEGSGLVASLVL